MYTKILVPLDGSTLSEGVLPHVRLFSRAMNLPVEILRVNDATQPTAHPSPLHGGEYFEKIEASFSGISRITHTIKPGNPAGVIVDTAAEESGTLIAMATHGYSGAQRWLLGSVAEKVLHAARNDLLVVRSGEGQSIRAVALKTLLVPLDGSEWAEKVLPTVIGSANCFQAEVLLLHVLIHFHFPLPEAVIPVLGMNIPEQKELWAQAKAEATKYLSAKLEQLRAQGLTHTSSMVIDGAFEGAAADILDLAAKIPDNLLVMSTHGRSGVGRWLLGSVVERVVRYLTGAVLVLRRQR